MNKIILSLSLVYLSSQFSFARKPAVEDTYTSSIEEYKEVEPSKAKGYNFSATRTPSANAQDRNHQSDLLKVESYNKSKLPENLMYLFFILLPVFVSAYSFFRVRKDSTKASPLASDVTENSNVTSLEEKRSERITEQGTKKAS